MRIKAVIFDLDGTLINSLDDLAVSGNVTLREMGMPEHEVAAYRTFVGDGTYNLAKRILPKDRAFSEEEIEEVRERMSRYYAAHSLVHTRPYDEIPALVGTLRGMGLSLGVYTNKPHSAAVTVVDALFAPGTFDRVMGQVDDRPIKPDPTAVLEMLTAFRISGGECLYVGDSGVDMRTAGNAGCVAVGVLWGYRSREELLQNGATYLIEHPEELTNLVK